jgi:hypothetical protein
MSLEKFNQPKQEEPKNNNLLKKSALTAGAVAASMGAMEFKDMANQGIEDQNAETHAMMRTPLSAPDGLSASIKSSVDHYRNNPDDPLIVRIPHEEIAEVQKHVDMIEGRAAEPIHVDLNEKTIPVTLNEKPIVIENIEH